MSDHPSSAQTNKPPNSAFRQQRLVAWQPLLSPPHVVACLLIIAAAFVPIGIAIVFANKTALDIERRYDDKRPAGKCSLSNNDALLGAVLPDGSNFTQGCTTVVEFDVPWEMNPPVYLYYKLTNFYQNHRRFAKSRSVGQLVGSNPSTSSMSDCDPILKPGATQGLGDRSITVNGINSTYGNMRYSPCGLVAWSMFNDSFTLYKKTPSGNDLVCNGSAFRPDNNQPITGFAGNCTKEGITWASDGDKFKPIALDDTIWSAPRHWYGHSNVTTPDVFMKNGWYAGELYHPIPVTTDQDLQVWMRTAALPSFRKLYRVINEKLPAGRYQMEINEFFPVESFGGTKSFALSTLSWVGGKNDFLGIAYLVIGGVSFVLAVVFFIAYRVNGARMQSAIDSLSELRE